MTEAIHPNDKRTESLMMHIASPRRDLDAPTQIKVNIPARMRIQLQAHKVITGESIGETVEHALAIYFAQLAAKNSGADISLLEL